jgi:hypothetical protein
VRAALAKFGIWCFPPSIDAGTEPLALNRDEVLLVMLALAKGDALTPVQIQKSLFLAGEEVGDAFRASSKYKFEPYDYGPFDKQVYADAHALATKGLVKIGTDSRGWNTYAATEDGLQRAADLRTRLNGGQREMLNRIVGLVRRLSFTQLVSAIYRKYPPMRARSVFRD